MAHPTTLLNYPGSLEDLAKEAGNLRYDSLASFLQALSDDLYRQAEADQKRGRVQLAVQGYRASFNLEQAAENIETAWKISQPYIGQEGKESEDKE